MKGKHILIADADRGVLGDLAARIMAESYDVTTASDALQAIHAFRDSRPDLVVLGIELPGGGGTLVHEQLKRTGQVNVPVVYLAGSAGGPLRDRASALRPAAIIDRPVAVDRLMRTIEELLASPADRAIVMDEHGARRLLVVEQDEGQRQYLRDCLTASARETAAIGFAHELAEARRLIGQFSYDCILLGHRLPDGPGYELLASSEEELLTTPVIAYTTEAAPGLELRYFRAGCADFLSGLELRQPDVVWRRVLENVSRFRRRRMALLVESRQRRDRRASDAPAREGLTVADQAEFAEYHCSYHQRTTIHQGPYALLAIDGDRLEPYRQRYGRSAGDDALGMLTQTLAASLRRNDFLGRHAGDAFMIILDATTALHVEQVAERLRLRVYERNIPHELNPPHGRVTVSIGVAAFDPGHPESSTSVVLRADEALQQAREAGGNVVAVAPPPPEDVRRTA